MIEVRTPIFPLYVCEFSDEFIISSIKKEKCIQVSFHLVRIVNEKSKEKKLQNDCKQGHEFS